MSTEDYFYLIAWSNLQGVQGINSHISQTIDSVTSIIYIEDSYWEVASTNRRNYAPTSSSASDFLELNTQISLANSGQTPSKGWVSLAKGGPRQTWTVNQLRFTSTFCWYSSDGQLDPTSPAKNHQEYLILRLRGGSGYEKCCTICPYGFYCPIGTSSINRCPDYQQTYSAGASSSSQCVNFPKTIYQDIKNISLVTESGKQFYQSKGIIVQNQANLFIKVSCDDQYSDRQGGANCSSITEFKIQLSFSDCSTTYTLSVAQSDLQNFKNQTIASDCSSIIIKTSLRIDSVYTEKQDSTIQESYVQASQGAEYHSRFILKDNYNFVYDVLKFNSTIDQAVSLKYSLGEKSLRGNAENDTFNLDSYFRYTVIYLTSKNDTLIVNDTQNSAAKTPTFFMLDGNDEITCFTDCHIYGGNGADTYQISGNTDMVIYDFNQDQDIIDLRTTHPKIKHQTHLSYLKTNSTTLKIKFSSTQTLTLYPVTGDIYDINLKLNAPSCYLKCNDCKSEDECKQCTDCGYCNSTHCLWCNATRYLEEGRCVSQCSENYLLSPLNKTKCTYCDLSNCQGCGEANNCTLCEDNYISVKGECQMCNTTYYSQSGDKTCTKCGDGCDNCNKTQCFKCSTGYLYAPRLSTQRCYSDTFGMQDQVITNTIDTNKYAGYLINNGLIVNSDGTISDLNSNFDDISSLNVIDQIQYKKYSDVDDLSVFFNIDETSSKRVLASSNIQSVNHLNIEIYYQYSEGWGEIRYNKEPDKKFKNYGCLITCHAMVLRALGFKINNQIVNPGNLHDLLYSKGLIKKGVGITYDAFDKFGYYKFNKKVGDGSKLNDNDFEQIKQQFGQNSIVILNVKRKNSKMHWVVMVGIDQNGSILHVLDPGYKNFKTDSKDTIREARIYTLSTGKKMDTKSVNAVVFKDQFDKKYLNYQSCYQYSKYNTESSHYTDVMKVISNNIGGLSKPQVFSNIIERSYQKSPKLTRACNQKSSFYQEWLEYIGIAIGVYPQTMSEGGSQLCSFAMVLETLGKQKDGTYYDPIEINSLLQINDAFRIKERKRKVLGSIKTFTTKDIIDFTKVSQKKLFSLTIDIQEAGNSGLTTLTNTQFKDLLNDLKKGQAYLFILEIVDIDQLDTYFVFSQNQVKDNQILVIDPLNGDQRYVSQSQIVAYTKFQNKYTYQALQIEEIFAYIAGDPHYHVVLSYQQDALKRGKKLSPKKYYLTNWLWVDQDYFNAQQFTAIDMNSDSSTYLKEVNIMLISSINDQTYILNKVEIYKSNEYKMDMTQLVNNQACTKKEVMAFIGMNQQKYSNIKLENKICFENSASESKCSTENGVQQCSVEKCQKLFSDKYESTEPYLQKLYDNQDSRYCAFAKLAYLYGQNEIAGDSSLVKEIQENKFYRAAYTMKNKKSSCLMKPRQAEEIFTGIFSNKSPRISPTIVFIEKDIVLSKIKQLVNSASSSSGQSQQFVSKAVLLALSQQNEKTLSEQNTEDFGYWLETKGYLRSDLTVSQAQPGDIIVFKGNVNNPFGHVVVKSDQSGIWYSDFKQTTECIYDYSQYIVYN